MSLKPAGGLYHAELAKQASSDHHSLSAGAWAYTVGGRLPQLQSTNSGAQLLIFGLFGEAWMLKCSC